MSQDLPESWLSTGFLSIFDVQGGTQPPKSEFIYEARTGYVQLLQIRDFGERSVPTFIPDTMKLKKCAESDILIARYGASLGRILTGMSGAYNVAMAKVAIPELMDRRFVYHLLKAECFQAPLRLVSRSAQNGFNKEDLSNFEIPLAPLPEQKRIADKLDSVLARVDACRDRLDRLPALLKRFRQSILTSATSGRLTEDWRKDNNVLWQWKNLCLGDIADIQGGVTKDAKKQSITDEELPYLRVANVQRGYLDLNEIKTIRIPASKLAGLLLKDGDILFNEGGDLDKLGRGWIWEGQIQRCSFQNHVFRARLLDQANQPKYISWWGNSKGLDYFVSSGKQTTNLASINKTMLSNLPISLPPPAEQTEIVRRVELLFAFADRLEARLAAARRQVGQLTPALLAKAFRGELVPQDPADEPAAELLKRLAAQREAAPKTRRGRASKA